MSNNPNARSYDAVRTIELDLGDLGWEDAIVDYEVTETPENGLESCVIKRVQVYLFPPGGDPIPIDVTKRLTKAANEQLCREILDQEDYSKNN